MPEEQQGEEDLQEASDDRCGGESDADADAASVATACSSEDLECTMLQPLSWVEFSCGDSTWFLVFSSVDGHALISTPMSAQDAAAWFLLVYSYRSHGVSLQHAWSCLPCQVRAAVLGLPIMTATCPLPNRPVLHMRFLLACSGCNAAPPFHCCSETFTSLYRYVWPKASLKEAMRRLGADIAVPYQRIQKVEDFNLWCGATGWSLALWPRAEVGRPGKYIISLGEVHSGIDVVPGAAKWYCGHYQATLPDTLLANLSSVGGVNLWRVLSLQPSLDRCGGTSLTEPVELPSGGFTVAKNWADLILAGSKTWEIRGERTKKRCRVAVLEKGRTTIRGDVEIVDCFHVGQWDGREWQPPTKQENYLWAADNMHKHCIKSTDAVTYNDAYAWVLQNPRVYKTAVPFKRPQGCMTWVKLQHSAKAESLEPLKTSQAESGCGRDTSGVAAVDRVVGVLHLAEPLPVEASSWIGQTCSAAETLGDGACAVHAAFGERTETGVLICHGARELAMHVLEAAMHSEDQQASRIKSTLWREMACRGMKEDEAAPEARLFWQTFADKFPALAEVARNAAVQQADAENRATQRHQVLTQACRVFFLKAPVAIFQRFCSDIGYENAEGQEPCFEVQGDRRLVKGTKRRELPADGPDSKLEAIRRDEEVFDALRTAVLWSADRGTILAALDRCSLEDEHGHAAALARALRDVHACDNAPSLAPAEFEACAVAAYLVAIQQQAYYFSVDEVQVICRQLGANVLIVKEVAPLVLLVEGVVYSQAGQDFRAIVLRGAGDNGSVRSHFERQVLSKQNVPKTQSVAAGHNEAVEHERDVRDSNSRTSGSSSREPASGSDRFEADVEHLLTVFEQGGDAITHLAALPHHSPEVEETSFAYLRDKLSCLVNAFETDRLASDDAVKLQYPLWRAGFYPLAVLFECWSRSTGIPAVFYADAFASLASSIWHKDIGADIAGFTTRSRYWCCGTAQPGGGKTPALEPMLRMLRTCMKNLPHFAPGSVADAFHTVEPMTHAAAIAKLRDTDGYGLIAAGEGGPMLCPAWPSNGTWTHNTHINLQRLLNAAQGGSVSWETVFDRKDRKAASAEGVDKGSQCESTNVTVALFQQLSVFRNWRLLCS